MVAHVGDEVVRRVAAVHLADLVDHGQHSLGIEIDHGDACALVGEQVRRRPTHARRSAGDEHALAGDRPGQGGQSFAHVEALDAGRVLLQRLAPATR